MTEEEQDRSFWCRHRNSILAAGLTLVVLPILTSVISTQLNEGVKQIGKEDAPGSPIQARVLSLGRDTTHQGGDWVFPPGRRVQPADLREAGDDQMRAKGAVDPALIRPVVILQGQRNEGVTITGIRVVPQCGPPLQGTLLYRPPGAGPMRNPRIAFDLDEPQLRARVPRRDGTLGADFFERTSITLRKNEQSVIITEMRTRRHHCTFEIFTDVSDGSRTVPVKVDAGKNRLAVTAYADSAPTSSQVHGFDQYQNLYVYENSAFVRKDPRHHTAGMAR